uniref:Uncharacterized protein n=1 Tax=Arundo donax TaxID=35708 RepID=A0A0A9GN99_ARUDO
MKRAFRFLEASQVSPSSAPKKISIAALSSRKAVSPALQCDPTVQIPHCRSSSQHPPCLLHSPHPQPHLLPASTVPRSTSRSRCSSTRSAPTVGSLLRAYRRFSSLSPSIPEGTNSRLVA